MYDRASPAPTGTTHAVERYLIFAETVLDWVGGKAWSNQTTARNVPLPDGDAPTVAADYPRDGFILLHPFARGTGKSLDGRQVEAICRRLAPRRVVLVGRRGDARFAVPEAVVDLLDVTSLSHLIWLMRRAACVVSVDSGPSHLAAALGRPLVAIHTWSDPRRVGPYRDDAWVWKNGRLLPVNQMRAVGEAFFQQPPKALSAEDVEAICALAISLSSSSA